MKVAKRLNHIAPFHVMGLLAKAKKMQAEGRDIIHLEVGEPDFSSPKAVINAGIKALEQGRTHYTAATGLPELRQAISGFYLKRYGKKVDPEQIVITPGASGALQLISSLLVNPDETLLLTDPGYPCNRHFLANINASGVLVPTLAEDSFHLTPSLVDEHWLPSTIGALVASPANPTGAVMGRDEMKKLHQSISDKNGYLIIDEIYHGLTYGLDAETAVDLADKKGAVDKNGNVFIINSFSKYFSMTGWRLGWLVAPKWAIKDLEKLAQNLFLAPSTPAQYAALSLFSDDCIAELEARRAQFSERLNYLLPAIQKLGFVVLAKPEGAFYIYADISELKHKYNQDSMAFCLSLLEETGVAITPGIDFGSQHGHHYVRFAYTADVNVLKDAVARIRQFLKTDITIQL
ncbi:MAG: aspartate/methionine/tyrosine aminotransferase [Francisellaceae bacterium]|jgi:aspartate/methionine/tyrosine aminotransferase